MTIPDRARAALAQFQVAFWILTVAVIGFYLAGLLFGVFDPLELWLFSAVVLALQINLPRLWPAFQIIGDESIGRAIVDTLAGHRSRAVLLANHGVFTIGSDAREAVKAAVMCEDVARTVHLACQLGAPVPIAPADVDALFDRYQNVYGQHPEGAL